MCLPSSRRPVAVPQLPHGQQCGGVPEVKPPQGAARQNSNAHPCSSHINSRECLYNVFSFILLLLLLLLVISRPAQCFRSSINSIKDTFEEYYKEVQHSETREHPSGRQPRKSVSVEKKVKVSHNVLTQVAPKKKKKYQGRPVKGRIRMSI
ncbi:hypothetical protein K461DRAFT_179123 [Myriangium duriaei CBS 260.36]|uniref:Uncharacterized protein n=1 Tax=Myriangium duriaei CBS 260.36 TaxID=1168546 RepID=A0A9P4J1E7_9PEZI|nr:hypothetical protein K461DRAFT_179123 [Myriangium duriaei CBS 260.36]